jgi:hypothetical protein
MTDMRKITAILPVDILESAQAFTGEGVTETLRIALERLAHAEWCRRFAALRGTGRQDLDLDALREDREFDDQGRVT